MNRSDRDIRPTPWWDATRHAERRPLLRTRMKIKSALRSWFEREGFTEVEPAILQVSPGNETHLHAFQTTYQAPADQTLGNAPQVRYLHTSPEFACKKLLAAGERQIFTFSPTFRNAEHTNLHHPEFTMLEWYRAGEDYRAMMSDCANILRITANAANTTQLHFAHTACDIAPDTLNAITVVDAFQTYAGINLADTLTNAVPDRDALADAARAQNLRVARDDNWSDIFSRIMTIVEPRLGVPAPTILKDYPVCEAALARRAPTDPRVAERFELYACGIELANGFSELTDPIEQRKRFTEQMDEKERRYATRYPIDEDFLAALAQMPPAAGCALGFDRLVMLAIGAPRIDDVRWTPLDL